MTPSTIYSMSLGLLTDLYQLTMAYGYWKENRQDDEAIFHLFFRKPAFEGNYTIACGLDYVIDFVQNFRFAADDIAYLATLTGNNGAPLFEKGFLDYLVDFRFEGDIDAMPEGTIVYPHQPLVRVTASLLAAQLLETALLNIINFQTLIATKSARICEAAQGEPVLEFGLRRAQGIDGGLTASRAAYIGGCVATSNVLAGKLFDIPVKGTHAHSWVMCFDDELAAFKAYATTMPNNCIFLVDTYDTLLGVQNAIKVGKWLRENGHEMMGIRLDSGDMAALSVGARRLLDEAGFENAVIVASNDLDEHKITALKKAGAKITVWGVGTNLVTAADQPALGGVYKLAAIRKKGERWQYRIKKSNSPIKTSNPGKLQVRRFYRPKGTFLADMLYNELADIGRLMVNKAAKAILIPENLPFDNLLVPIFRKGKLIYQKPDIHTIRQHTQGQLRLFRSQKNYSTGIEIGLQQLKVKMVRAATQADSPYLLANQEVMTR